MTQRPVIATRVSVNLHKKIKRAAKASGRSMSEELAYRAAQAFDPESSITDLVITLRALADEIEATST